MAGDSHAQARKALVEENMAASRAYVLQLESSVASMRAELDKAAARMDAFHEAGLDRGRSGEGGGALVHVVGREKKSATEMDSIMAQTAEMNRLNRDEIQRLHSTIAQQRKVIFELESVVQEMEQDLLGSGEGADKQLRELDALKRILRETEDCVFVLESEVDTLQQKLEVPYSATADYAAINESLTQQMHELRSELAQTTQRDSENQYLLDYLRDVVVARSLQDMALVLVETLRLANVDSYILFNTSDDQVTASSSSRLPVKLRKLMEACTYSGREEVRKINEGTLIITPSVVAVFDTAGKDLEKARSHKRALNIIRLASPLVLKVAAQQDAQNKYNALRYAMDAIKKLSETVDGQYSYQSLESENLIKSMSAQYGELIRLMKPTANQLQECESIEREVLGRLELLGQNRTATKVYFERLLNHLEEAV